MPGLEERCISLHPLTGLLSTCFLATGWSFKGVGIGESLVTSPGGKMGGGAVQPALFFTEKRAGASQAAGLLPAGGGPGLLLEH